MTAAIFKHPLVCAADAFAEEAHRGQRRKYTGEPYISHPRAVAAIVASVSHTVDMVAAALLHDVLEDTRRTVTEIGNKFGFDVARMVWGLTNQAKPSDGNRMARAEINRRWLAKGAWDVQTIKVADILHNVPSIVENDPDFARVYVREKLYTLAALTRADYALYTRANEQLRTYAKRCGIAL